MIALAAALVFTGCMSLALGQSAKWKIVTASMLDMRTGRVIRICGWLLLCAALVVCIIGEGAGFAVLLWTLLIAAASFIVAMILSFRPRLLKPFARFYLGFFS